MTRDRKARVLQALRNELYVSVEVAGEALGIGRNSAYSGVKLGQIPSIKVGRRITVPTAPLRKMLGLEEEHRA